MGRSDRRSLVLIVGGAFAVLALTFAAVAGMDPKLDHQLAGMICSFLLVGMLVVHLIRVRGERPTAEYLAFWVAALATLLVLAPLAKEIWLMAYGYRTTLRASLVGITQIADILAYVVFEAILLYRIGSLKTTRSVIQFGNGG